MEMTFEVPAQPTGDPGSLNLDARVRQMLAAALKGSPVPRVEIASRLALLTGRPITVHMVNSWTAPARHGWQFPFWLAVPFELAAETYALTELHNATRGCRALIGRDALLAELGKLERDESLIKTRKRALRQQMGAGA